MAEISQGKPINDLGSRPVNSRSKFNNSYNVGGTYRYGEVSPHFYADVVPDDNHRLISRHSVRSYTLSAPLLEGIDIHKDYFYVPLSAILPNNYKYFITSPNIGEDVPDDVGTAVINFRKMISDIDSLWLASLEEEVKYIDLDDESYALFVATFFRFLAWRNLIASSGSLLNAFDAHLFPKGRKFDKGFDDVFSRLCSDSDILDYIGFETDDVYRVQFVGDPSPNDVSMSVRDFIDTIMSGLPFAIRGFGGTKSAFVALYEEYISKYSLAGFDDDGVPFDLAVFYAYQIICSHFYSNDHVDFIYSADLYRQNLRASLQLSGSSIPIFRLNGVDHEYDVCSAKCFTDFISFMSSLPILGDTEQKMLLGYFCNIFGFQKSLKFVDYFTGSRVEPLALGDDGVAVNDGMVSVVDVLEKRWYVKLWNQINRVGHRMEEQIKGLFPGVEVTTDWTEPIWLGSSKDTINPVETDNTSEAQMSEDFPIPVTSSLVSNAERYGFDLQVKDRYGFVIGLTWFDMRRYYMRTIARRFFYSDRYDHFNPFLQYVGDQKVYSGEINGVSDTLAPLQAFGYQGRNMEYKQRYSYAFGGFINDALPNMLPLADGDLSDSAIITLTPEYIRSKPSELDKFYKSLTGFSLGTYFHFLIINDNVFESVRPMSYNPQID